jgi:aminopeptidase N
MEHQSAVAYGNKYGNGYLGRDLSGTGWGLKWDYIVVHESGHEWFGNNISAKDYADMWIHEGFTYYSESLFTETYYGKQAGLDYVNGSRVGSLSNSAPIGGLIYGVSKEGSGDMYNKGGVILNMVRTMINDDEKWRGILRGLNSTFYHQTVTYNDITQYISKQSGINLTSFFEQYIHTKDLPVLEFGMVRGKLSYRWTSCVPNFTMPVKVRMKGGEYKYLTPTTRFMAVPIDGLTKDNIEVDTFNYYIGVLID